MQNAEQLNIDEIAPNHSTPPYSRVHLLVLLFVCTHTIVSWASNLWQLLQNSDSRPRMRRVKNDFFSFILKMAFIQCMACGDFFVSYFFHFAPFVFCSLFCWLVSFSCNLCTCYHCVCHCIQHITDRLCHCLCTLLFCKQLPL